MEVEVNKENICINRLITEKKEIFFVQNDVIVPDTKPDILNTINASGNICINKKEVLDGKVKAEGNINTYIMYLPDSKDENLRALNCVLDFSQNITIEGATEGMTLITNAIVKDIECKVINGRKITLKAGVELDIKLYSNEEVSIINQINNIKNIQLLNESFSINSLIGQGKTIVYAKDTLKGDEKDKITEILKADVIIVNKDLKYSYNKILTKAEAEIKVMYLTEDNRIGRIDGKIPIVGFIDMKGISEDNICDINYEMKNILVKLNGTEEHSIYVELEIEPTCIAYEKRELNIIQDLYSPTTNLKFSQKKVVSVAQKMENSKNYDIKGNVEISGLEEGNLIDVEEIPILENIKTTDSKIIYKGQLSLNFIFTNANTLNSVNTKIPFEVSEENIYKTNEINIETDLNIGNTSFEVNTGGKVEAKVELQVITKMSKNVNINIIDNIEASEDNIIEDDYDSLILYVVAEGDSLWKIAKKFNSTIEELSILNGIEDIQNISVGQKIYIPKFNYIKKENVENAREKATI